MNPSPYLLRFSGRASQKWTWPSTTKYLRPFFSYIPLLSLRLLDRLKVEADVLGRVLRVGEQQRPVVEVNHTPVVGAHDLLEVVLSEVGPAEGVRDLLVVEVDLADAVDADHGGQLHDGDAILVAHDAGHHVADLVVHQRDARLVRRGAVRSKRRHAEASFGVSSPRSPTRPSKRTRERSKESSKRTTFSDSWDQMGWSRRAASTALGV